MVDKIRKSPNTNLEILLERNGSEETVDLIVPEEARIGIGINYEDLSVTDTFSFFTGHTCWLF